MGLRGDLDVERGINQDRATALFFILAFAQGAGLAVGFGVSWALGVASFVGAMMLAGGLVALVYRQKRVRHWAMSAVHWLTRE